MSATSATLLPDWWSPIAERGDAGRVAEFLDAVSVLSWHDWLARGAAEQARTDAAPRAAAQAVLEAALGTPQLIAAAWYVRDAVQTLAQVATCSAEGEGAKHWTVARVGAAEQHRCAAAVRAVERAALALLAHDRLSCRELATLVAPFEREALAASAGRVR
jgi:hypothetical protein